jgi:hypothetical protein
MENGELKIKEHGQEQNMEHGRKTMNSEQLIMNHRHPVETGRAPSLHAWGVGAWHALPEYRGVACNARMGWGCRGTPVEPGRAPSLHAWGVGACHALPVRDGRGCRGE